MVTVAVGLAVDSWVQTSVDSDMYIFSINAYSLHLMIDSSVDNWHKIVNILVDSSVDNDKYPLKMTTNIRQLTL